MSKIKCSQGWFLARVSPLLTEGPFSVSSCSLPIEHTHKDATAAKFVSAKRGLNTHLTKLTELNEIMYESDWQSTSNRVSPQSMGITNIIPYKETLQNIFVYESEI